MLRHIRCLILAPALLALACGGGGGTVTGPATPPSGNFFVTGTITVGASTDGRGLRRCEDRTTFLPEGTVIAFDASDAFFTWIPNGVTPCSGILLLSATDQSTLRSVGIALGDVNWCPGTGR